MNTVALQDFQSYAKVNDNVINKFKNKIPETLLKIWQNYGLGTFMNGYIKVINPDDYQSIIDNTYFPYKDAVPVFVTAFGDIITLESGEYISIMHLRYGKCELMLKDFDFFLKRLAIYGEIIYNYSVCMNNGIICYLICTAKRVIGGLFDEKSEFQSKKHRL